MFVSYCPSISGIRCSVLLTLAVSRILPVVRMECDNARTVRVLFLQYHVLAEIWAHTASCCLRRCRTYRCCCCAAPAGVPTGSAQQQLKQTTVAAAMPATTPAAVVAAIFDVVLLLLLLLFLMVCCCRYRFHVRERPSLLRKRRWK